MALNIPPVNKCVPCTINLASSLLTRLQNLFAHSSPHAVYRIAYAEVGQVEEVIRECDEVDEKEKELVK